MLQQAEAMLLNILQTTYTGGTYSHCLEMMQLAFQIAADGLITITSTAMQQYLPGGDNERNIVRTYTQGENVLMKPLQLL